MGRADAKGDRSHRLVRRPRCALAPALLASVLTLAIAGTAAAAKTVRVAIHDTPFSSIDDKGEPSGFYVELISHIGAAEGWRVEYVTGTWPEVLAKYEQGEADLLFPMVPSAKGRERYDYTDEPLVTTWGRVFASEQHAVESLFDLRGKTIGLVEDDLFGAEIIRLLDNFSISHSVHETGSTSEVFEAISAGLADVAAVEQIDGSQHALSAGLVETPIVFKPVAGHVAARKDRFAAELIAIDRQLIALKDDPDSIYWRSYSALFAAQSEGAFPVWGRWALIIGGITLVLLVVFVVTLRAQVARGTQQLRLRNHKLEREIERRAAVENEKREIESQLREAQRLEAVGQLAGGIAHDFNNMLAAIITTSELALGRLDPEDEVRGDIIETIAVAGRASALTRQLLAFGRKQTLRPKLLELNKLFADLDEMLRRTIGEDIQLSFDLAAGLWPVKADPAQLQQVILNLVVNARDAMTGGGRLRIVTGNVTLERESVLAPLNLERGDYAQISVIDTGVGMDDKVRNHIFEPFFSTKRSERSAGLGLSTSHGIITQSGGAISVESTPGEGTEVHVYLPRSAEEPPRTSALGSVSIKKSAATVLLVEDEDVVRRSVARLLQRSGLRTLPAANGEEALAISAEHQGPIHLILTDVVMPGIKGPEVAKRLLIDRPEAKVIFMSAHDRELMSEDGILDDDVELLDKPFTTPELLAMIRKVLDIEIE